MEVLNFVYMEIKQVDVYLVKGQVFVVIINEKAHVLLVMVQKYASIVYINDFVLLVEEAEYVSIIKKKEDVSIAMVLNYVKTNGALHENYTMDIVADAIFFNSLTRKFPETTKQKKTP